MNTGRRTSRSRALVVAVLVVVASVATVTAGHELAGADPACTTANHLTGSNFEIDANANLKVDGAPDCIDWLADGTGSPLRTGVLAKNDQPSGTGDDAFGQGTHEDNPNPTIVSGSIPPNKSDLKVFGVYTETAATAKFLDLFWSRINSPQGTVNMDFELNQKFCDPTATPTNCANNGTGVTPETPIRTTGDLLISYDLSNGGTVPIISIRTWNGSAWGPASIISGPGGTAIGSINTSSIAAADSGGIGPLDPLTFGEAAINFSALFPPGTTCGTFGSAYLKSRSSTSFTAEVKDFVGPERVTISNCTALTTNATTPVTIGSPISDTATLSGATLAAGGTITFHLFSDAACSAEVFTSTAPVNGNGDYNSGTFTPAAPGTYFWTASYSGDINNAPSQTACGDANESSVVNPAQPGLTTNATTPVGIGSPISDTATLSGGFTPTGTITFHAFSDAACASPVFTSTATVNGNGNYNSGNFTPTTAGTYRWTASYSGDTNNKPVSTSCGDANESSVINPAQPGLTTNATTPVTVNSPISDTATLSGGFNPTGTITFHLFSNAACSTQVFTSTVSVNGNGNYNSGNFTPTTAGTYRWTASYSGDTNNKPVSTSCGDANESSVINPAQPGLTTHATTPVTVNSPISDTATLSGGFNPTGTITFHLFSNAACSTQVFTSTVSVNGNGNYNSGNFTPTTAGTYLWTASYSGDTNNKPVSTSCGDANESSVVNPAQPGLTTNATTPVTVNSPISDTATLSGGFNPTGTITFHLFSNAACSTQVFTSTVSVNGNGNYNSGNFTPTTAGTYLWTASYSGDTNNKPVSTSCGDANESSVVNPAQPGLTTSATPSVTVGSPISDTATLSGGFNPTGTITFHAFSNAACSTEVFTSTVSVNGNGNYNSTNFTPTAAGTYLWTASYSGDTNNKPVSTSCGDANESSVVNPAQPSLTTHATTPVTVNSPISDTATLSGGFNPTGTITFHLFSNAACSTQVFTSTVSVNGNGNYNSGNFTPTTAGTYLWTATYSGDANNNPVSTSCGDANESSVVNPAQPGLTTHATTPVTIGSPISDTATLSGGFNPTGTITFHLFSNAACSTQVFTSTVSVNGNGNYNSGNFTPNAVGTYLWTASYSGDTNNKPVSTSCGDANESSVVNPAPSNVTTAQSWFPQDSATVTAGAGGTPTGTVTFSLFGPNDTTCSAGAVFTQAVPLSGGSAATSNTTFSVSAATNTTYRWVVAYPGDTTHQPTTSNCTENTTLSIVNG